MGIEGSVTGGDQIKRVGKRAKTRYSKRGIYIRSEGGIRDVSKFELIWHLHLMKVSRGEMVGKLK